MDLNVNGIDYAIEDISTSTELHIPVSSSEEGAEVFLALREMRSYMYNGILYADRIVSKITLSEIRDGDIKVVVRLRPMFAGELMSQELQEARAELNSLKNRIGESEVI